MPEISGYDLARYIRQDEKYATLPILFLTAEQEMEAKIDSVKAGGDDYSVKPVSAGLLLSPWLRGLSARVSCEVFSIAMV